MSHLSTYTLCLKSPTASKRYSSEKELTNKQPRQRGLFLFPTIFICLFWIFPTTWTSKKASVYWMLNNKLLLRVACSCFFSVSADFAFTPATLSLSAFFFSTGVKHKFFIRFKATTFNVLWQLRYDIIYDHLVPVFAVGWWAFVEAFLLFCCQACLSLPPTQTAETCEGKGKKSLDLRKQTSDEANKRRTFLESDTVSWLHT